MGVPSAPGELSLRPTTHIKRDPKAPTAQCCSVFFHPPCPPNGPHPPEPSECLEEHQMGSGLDLQVPSAKHGTSYHTPACCSPVCTSSPSQCTALVVIWRREVDLPGQVSWLPSSNKPTHGKPFCWPPANTAPAVGLLAAKMLPQTFTLLSLLRSSKVG